jgi:hypothetical protein
MKKLLILISWVCCINHLGFTQKLSSVPVSPTINEEISVRFNIDSCSNKSLVNYTGDVYVHTGVYIKGNASWAYVIAEWSENIAKAKCTRINANIYEFTITPDIKEFYGIQSGDTVTSLNFVIRSSDGSKQTEDLFLPVYETGLTIEITNPQQNLIVEENNQINIQAKSISIGISAPDYLNLYLDNALIHSSTSDTIEYSLLVSEPGIHWIIVEGESGGYSDADSIFYFVKNNITSQDVPEGMNDGINYSGDSAVTLVLFAPLKDNVFVLGDFNNWELDNSFQMIQTPDGKRWWLTISKLDPETEYAFQYLVDGNLKIADPYTEKILDPWHDSEIPASTYPDLKLYPSDKTSEIVSILHINKEEYTWSNTGFIKPDISDLVIYEVHIQNYTEAGNIKALQDSLDYLSQLGVNVIEVMPVNEFEGNISWGYNPSFYFAIDKIYGRKNDFKSFVDECHSRGIAVIVDMVLNHSFGQSSLVRLYWDDSANKPSADNPWFNQEPTHDFNVGFDMNHESEQTKAFSLRVIKYWLEEFKIDGFRFDLSKGFTQNNTLGNSNAMAQYDASRIAIWKYYADSIWSISDDAIIILEHFADNSEEKELSNYGMLLWGNMNHQFNEATMGYTENNKSDLGWAFYSSRNWDNPHAVVYMESHDEERLMYKNTEYGNSNEIYSVKELETGLQRIETAAAFFFTIPGPKMIWEWGELGYDYSINTCLNGTVGDCRLDLKPIKWDYYKETSRYRLYKVFEALIDFKYLNICKTNDFSFDLNGPLKVTHLNGTDTNAIIIGNFDIVNQQITPVFQHTGDWFDYLSGDTLTVDDVNVSLKLKPGEYRIYTDEKIEVIDLPPSFSIPDVTSQKKIDDKKTVAVFPNPINNNTVNFKINDSNVKLERIDFYNATGKLLLSNSAVGSGLSSFSINLEEVKDQLLIYKIISNETIIQGILINN